MTPEERRKKYPLRPITPMTDEEIEDLWQKATEWIEKPPYTSSLLDMTYTKYARLIVTIRERGIG